jgi:hypothetical protein
VDYQISGIVGTPEHDHVTKEQLVHGDSFTDYDTANWKPRAHAARDNWVHLPGSLKQSNAPDPHRSQHYQHHYR